MHSFDTCGPRTTPVLMLGYQKAINKPNFLMSTGRGWMFIQLILYACDVDISYSPFPNANVDKSLI